MGNRPIIRKTNLKRTAVLLVGLLVFFVVLDSLRGALGLSDKNACASTLIELASEMTEYARAKGNLPPASVPNTDLVPERRFSWIVAISVYSDRYAKMGMPYDLKEAWDSPANLRLAKLENGYSWRCPASAIPLEGATLPAITNFVGISGIGPDASGLPTGHPRAGVFGEGRVTRPGDVKDGASVTMAIIETTLQNGPWCAGGHATVRELDPSQLPFIGPGRQFGGLHRKGVNVAFADGSVRFVQLTIALKVFQAIATVAGGEPVGDLDDVSGVYRYPR